MKIQAKKTQSGNSKINLIEWMTKNHVGACSISLDYGSSLAIEHEHKSLQWRK